MVLKYTTGSIFDINLVKWTGGRMWLLSIAACLANNIGHAIDESTTDAPAKSVTNTAVDASEQLGALQRQILDVAGAYGAYTNAADGVQKDRLWGAYVQANDSVIPEILTVVRQNPSSPMAFGLLEWVVTNGRISAPALQPYGLQAVELLRDYHTSHPNLGPICRTLGHYGDPLHRPTKEFLQIASANNPDRTARGFAIFTLALLTKRKAESMAFFEIAPSSIYTNAAFQKNKANYQEEAKAADSRTLLHQADVMFETVIGKFADCPNFPPGPGLQEPKPTLGDQAGVELYECRHLEPGRVAPEIDGEDIDGHKFKLSEYRSKVVVLVFWATWCGPCMQMVTHERAMAKRLQGKPFALVGVDADEGKAAAKRAMAKENMTWRSFWNGGGWEGGIAAAWNVQEWPTVYVLDAKGMIRLKQHGYGGKSSDALLDELVDRLLKEVETGKE